MTETPGDRVFTANEPDEINIGELQVAEYLLMLFAFDTYAAFLEHVGRDLATDSHGQRGLKILRVVDSQNSESIKVFLDEAVTRDVSLRQIERTFRVRVANPVQAARRALTLRTVLNRGGPSTLKAVFKDARARKAAKSAIASHMLDQPSDALTKYAMVSIQNVRIKAWVRACIKMLESEAPEEAREASAAVVASSPIEGAADTAASAAKALKGHQMAEDGAYTAEEIQDAQRQQSEVLTRVQDEATAAAKESLYTSGDSDEAPTRSEVVGIATAAAVAASAELGDQDNIPESLKMLDPEQRAAALTDGRVLVAAGAGAGKSTTLVRRVKYLVGDRQVPPGRILVSSFNKKAAVELEHKIGKAVGAQAASLMTVGTLHGTFRRAIIKYGTAEEKAMFESGFVGTGGKVASSVNRVWRKCFGHERPDGSWEDAAAPSTGVMMMAKTKWAGNGISPSEALAGASSPEEVEAAKWYEMYLGFKGDLGPGWAPKCENQAEAQREWERFNEKTRTRMTADGQKVRVRLGDFDDMISVFRDILKRRPDVRKRAQAAYDHILVDESQDLNEVQHEVMQYLTEHVTDGTDGKSYWMIGDDKQCVSEDTPVLLEEGKTASAKELRPGDSVLAYRNGRVVTQTLRHVEKSSWAQGFRITTEGGNTLTMSPNHKIWAQAPSLVNGQVAVYLMFRRDMGFRVGITNKCHADDYLNSFGGRAFMEKAERMWILDVCNDREAALLKEICYSLEYGIPTMVFGGENRGINQDRVDQIFQKFGHNGSRVLEDKHLSFDLPHWVSQTYTKHGRVRRTIQMTAHAAVGTQVALEWSGPDLDVCLERSGIAFKQLGDRRRLRKWFTNYRSALEFAERLQTETGANLSRRLSTADGPVRLTTASGLHPGMRVLTLQEGALEQDIITSVEVVDGTFLDLDVDDASNFFGGGILSHNSIYAFRGARPELFTQLDGKEGWKTRTIRTNYRCPPEVVELANRLISHNEDRIDIEANPAPGKSRGQASIVVDVHNDEAETAMAVARHIKGALDADEADIADNAVLCRTNKELNSYETALLLKGIPYARKGNSSFLGSPETKSFLGYVTLVTDSDHGRMQEAMASILNTPNRFFVSPDKAERALDYALNNYARKNDQSKKTINPLTALRDPEFQEDLVYVLKGDRRGFKAKKALNQVDRLLDALNELESMAQSDEASTKDLFDSVLEMPGIKFDVDPYTGRIRGEKEVTFREELSASLKDYGGSGEDATEDDDEEEELTGLGNVSFLYALAKPDPDDPGDQEVSPETPKGFWAKMERLRDRADELRYDIDAWEKEQADLPPEDRKPPPGVYLGTAHSTKGAQWPNVFVQMPAGRFPMEPRVEEGQDITPEMEAEMAAEMEAERRLAYVALTRPSQNLRVVCPKTYKGKPAGVSQFVAEAGLVIGENVNIPDDPAENEIKTASAFVEDAWKVPS